MYVQGEWIQCWLSVCVHIRGATTQHAAEVLRGIPLGAIITAALKRGGAVAQCLALPYLTSQIKSTTAERASNSSWRAICSRRLRHAHILDGGKKRGRFLLDTSMMYVSVCGVLQRPSWRKTSLQDQKWRCRGGRAIYNAYMSIKIHRCWTSYPSPAVIYSCVSRRHALWQLLSYITNKRLHFSAGFGNTCEHLQMWQDNISVLSLPLYHTEL